MAKTQPNASTLTDDDKTTLIRIANGDDGRIDPTWLDKMEAAGWFWYADFEFVMSDAMKRLS
jgi:hypothetical protein